jgi:hypothetical protein
VFVWLFLSAAQVGSVHSGQVALVTEVVKWVYLHRDITHPIRIIRSQSIYGKCQSFQNEMKRETDWAEMVQTNAPHCLCVGAPASASRGTSAGRASGEQPHPSL